MVYIAIPIGCEHYACIAHGKPFFLKQWGNWANNPTPRNLELAPHAKGGATLDGRLRRDFPGDRPAG